MIICTHSRELQALTKLCLLQGLEVTVPLNSQQKGCL